jgi:hypothetical protein
VNLTPSHGAWWAFRAGLARALRCWPVMLLFYGALVLVASLLLMPLARMLIGWIGHNLAASEIAQGLPGWLVAEWPGSLIQPGKVLQPLSDWFPLVLLTLPVWPFLLAVPSTLLSAGAIAAYTTATPRTDWRRLGRGLARYAPAFLLLLLVEVTLYELALLATILLTALVIIVTGSLWGLLAAAPLLAIGIVVIPWWFEYARTLAVVEERRNVFQALGRAFNFLTHHLGPAAALAIYHFLLTLLPYLPFFLLTWLLPASWWGGWVLLQQALILTLVAARLVRMAGQVALVQARAPAALSSPGDTRT